MIQIIPAEKRHYSDFSWLKTYWLFSFSDYYDPQNIQFGPLRVFNDDVVMPGYGFPTHPHREMEIITIVLSGEITHEDSMGNQNVIRAGDVQRMSAGVGITHSEFNLSDHPVRFYQVWIYPDVPGLKPSYDQRTYKYSDWKNTLLPLASGRGLQNVVTFNADATIYRAELDSSRILEFASDETRRTFIYLTAGRICVNGTVLHTNDQARMDLEDCIKITAEEDSSFVVIDLPNVKGWGYDQNTLKGTAA
jgi:redox-sensitive bicupin YhaK (pirin superfamily)